MGLQLIPDWKNAHKFLSVIAAGVGAVAYTAIEIAQDAHGLNLPVPHNVDNIIAYLTFAGMVLGRLVNQPGVTNDQ